MNPAARPVPLQLVTFAILSPLNAPLYIHSYTGKQDEFRYVQIAHSALDIIEEKESISEGRGLESYLGLLCVMDDLAVYGYRSPSRIRIIVSVALMDAVVRDNDVVTICRAIHQLYNKASSNPFSLLAPSSTKKDLYESLPGSLAKSQTMKIGAQALGRLLDGNRL